MGKLHRNLKAQHIAAIRAMVQRAGVFSDEEIEVAEELVRESLERGAEKSGYSFSLYEEHDVLAGYACYGRISLTESSYDLYWLVTDPAFQKQGIAQLLLKDVEEALCQAGGGCLYAETSSTDKYEPARRFYLKAGFAQVSELKDFYKRGDHRITYAKLLSSGHLQP